MPIYEYTCQQCNLRFSKLWLSARLGEELPSCPSCASSQVARVISRIARVRSEASRLEALADPRHFADLDENDPGSLSRWAKKMEGAMGEDLGEDFGTALEESIAEESKGPLNFSEGSETL